MRPRYSLSLTVSGLVLVACLAQFFVFVNEMPTDFKRIKFGYYLQLLVGMIYTVRYYLETHFRHNLTEIESQSALLIEIVGKMFAVSS